MVLLALLGCIPVPNLKMVFDRVQDLQQLVQTEQTHRHAGMDAAARPLPATPATDLTTVAEHVVQSVASVRSTRHVRIPTMWFAPRPMAQTSDGSAVLVAEDLLLTNHHVVAGASSMTVSFGGEELPVSVVGSDIATDLAVLRLRKAAPAQPLEWGDSSSLRLGQDVLAVGNSFGLGQTVTRGIVSAKGRGGMGIVEYEDFIQTDAAINPGNSGGPLVDMEGRVVGINTAIVSRSGGAQGVGFAIPSDMARSVLEAILEDGQVARGWLGVAISEHTDGVRIEWVGEDTPAWDAGLRQGDIIVAIDGEEVRSVGSFRTRVSLAGPGADLDLRRRDGGTVQVELAPMPTG